MSLLPTTSERSAEPEVEVVGLEEGGDALVDALSSATAREILALLNDEPMPPSEVADAVDTSLQNVHYHLENLEEAGAVEAIDTEYSEKGREMTVYAPAGEPLVIVSGTDEGELKEALRTLLGGVAVLAAASVVVQVLSPEVPSREDIVNAAGSPAMPAPPGLVFFAGGAFVLLAAFAVWYVRNA